MEQPNKLYRDPSLENFSNLGTTKGVSGNKVFIIYFTNFELEQILFILQDQLHVENNRNLTYVSSIKTAAHILIFFSSRYRERINFQTTVASNDKK